MPGDIIIVHMCIINDNHIRYGSWDMDRDEKGKKSLSILSFYTSLP